MKNGALVLVSVAAAFAAPSTALSLEARPALGFLVGPADTLPLPEDVPTWFVHADSDAVIRFPLDALSASYSIPGIVAFLRGGSDGGLARASQWLAPMRERLLTVRYDWRGITLEGATMSVRPANGRPDATRWDLRSRGARLSLRPLPSLVLRFSRGTWNYLDRLVANDKMRRTSLSATYTKDLTGGEWRTTLAWGRSAPAGHDSVYGYLVESSVRFARDHLAFGRLEQVGGDELMGSFPSSLRAERLRKVSLGYYQDLASSRAGRIGVGLMASRYLLPDAKSVTPDNPTIYMLFMRVDMH